MNKLTKEKRDKILLVAMAAGAVLAAIYLLVISAQQRSLADYRAKVETAQEKLTKAERWLRMAPSIEARLDGSRKELETKQEEMAPADKFKWFYNTLEGFLAKHRVTLVDITREPELGDVGVLPNFPYQSATFGVKLSARFHDFGAFLADFENQFPYMRVQNLELQPEGVSGSTGTVSSSPTNRRLASAENLAVTMRVVALVKPSAPL